MIRRILCKLGFQNKAVLVTYYVCPFDGTHSGEMQYCGKINLFHTTYDERDALNGTPIIRERLQCPKCQRVFGWHQLKKIEIYCNKKFEGDA